MNALWYLQIRAASNLYGLPSKGSLICSRKCVSNSYLHTPIYTTMLNVLYSNASWLGTRHPIPGNPYCKNVHLKTALKPENQYGLSPSQHPPCLTRERQLKASASTFTVDRMCFAVKVMHNWLQKSKISRALQSKTSNLVNHPPPPPPPPHSQDLVQTI